MWDANLTQQGNFMRKMHGQTTLKNAEILQYTILYLKYYASNIFRSVMGHLQGGRSPITYKPRINMKLG